jgi:hypothetical protein
MNNSKCRIFRSATGKHHCNLFGHIAAEALTAGSRRCNVGGRIGEQHNPHRTVKMLIERALIGLRRSEIWFYRCSMDPFQTASKSDDQDGRVIEPAEWADTPHSILVKTYTGKQGEATALFRADRIEMATQAYFPTWQCWTPGEWARETYIFAALLIPLLGIGLLRLAYLLIVEPDGALAVTYERRPAPVDLQ